MGRGGRAATRGGSLLEPAIFAFMLGAMKAVEGLLSKKNTTASGNEIHPFEGEARQGQSQSTQYTLYIIVAIILVATMIGMFWK